MFGQSAAMCATGQPDEACRSTVVVYGGAVARLLQVVHV